MRIASVDYKRPDGTFVVTLASGLPYHVTAADPLFAEAQRNGRNAPPEPERVEPTIDPTEANVRREGARRIRQAVAAANGGTEYSIEEMLTWPEQTLAVVEYQKDAEPVEADHPMLASLAAGRGITMAQMAAMIVAKRDAYTAIARSALSAQAALLAMDPIPADYDDDKWWTA